MIFGQASGGRDPVLTALTNLQAVGQEHGCDAIVAVRLMSHSAGGGLTVVAYGTGVRFLPAQSPPAAGDPLSPMSGAAPPSEAQQSAGGDSPPPPSYTRS